MDIAVNDAAERLGVHPTRVRQLVRSGDLAGHRVGRVWLVDPQDVARLAGQKARAGRPLAPARAWGLLDLLDGGSALWLPSVARSQVRHLLSKLNGADADCWRAALRSRSQVLRVRAHPAAISRLLAEPQVLAAGPAEAARMGVDLLAMGQIPQFYVPSGRWPELVRALHIVEMPAESNLLVRLPRGVWPFEGHSHPGVAALAADLLESAEPRAVSGGVAKLNELSTRTVGARR
jgi:excisionase family DNA binding protein